ncbi:unnamed protein product [Polarella glacialis]|uniref:Globin family profile domain-containing protein n=1 Tax=Polarella glacialis TaxID=89957 RepID=A0A813E4V8_POLGL|nr:unnamed protein product [Polarella glacialis]CAE8716991.1 unnamed protein product [Polarella glacialis]
MSNQQEEFEATEEVTEEVSDMDEEEAEVEGENEAGAAVDAEVEEIINGALTEVQDKTLEEIRLPEDTVAEVQGTWTAYLNSASSRDAAGEAIYGAIFDSAPSVQSLFKTPRAVMAMRIMGGINNIVNAMHTPAALKTIVESLGFQHLDLDVTVPRVIIFRDAIVDLLGMELEARFTSRAKSGWQSILNYTGGAYIYVRREYAGRLKIIASSWATANKKAKEFEDAQAGDGDEAVEGVEADKEGGETDGEMDRGPKEDSKSAAQATGAQASGEKTSQINSMIVPTTFNEMFMFNGAVMGFSNSVWMHEVLESFDDMASNVQDSYRLQEECDTLGLRLAKYRGTVNLSEFKSVMLASLRSLVPKDWNSAHEVAWTWLWENVERMLKALMGKPQVHEKALESFIMSLSEDSRNYLRRQVFKSFFALAPAGQDYFKQSSTRLYWIVDQVVAMTIEIYKDPRKMVEELSALGLRHVGYGIPTEFFAPLVSGYVEVVRTLTTDENAEDGFRWSLSLISRILVRTINEGSTIVMKAINTNSARQLEMAVACAPRGKRALWQLNITVGTQSISPFYWSIESGSSESARAMLIDLLTIRADRDNYYYGLDHLFERHPDVVQRLCADAQALLPTLLDGLIWRSRLTPGGRRRVNFYLKHLIQDADEKFNQALEWMVDAGDPKILCHPVVVLFADLVWGRLANKYFLLGKCWFLFTLMIFITSQSILQYLNEGPKPQSVRRGIFALRCFIYLCSLGQLIHVQAKNVVRDIRAGNLRMLGGIIRVPEYWTSWKNFVALLLVLVLMFMLANEPIIWCLPHYDADGHRSDELLDEMAASGDHAVAAASGAAASTVAASAAPAVAAAGHRLLPGGAAVATAAASAGASAGASVVVDYSGDLFRQHCPEGQGNLENYAPASMVAILLYWTLIVDLSVFSTRISAFVMVCGRVVSELSLFLMAAFFLVLAFASAISSLDHHIPDFSGIPQCMMSLTEITLSMWPTEHFAEMQDSPIVFACVAVYIILAMIFLLNLLVAQLNGAYQAVSADMVGYARLNRGRIICQTVPVIPARRWRSWLATLRLDERLEFNEGDVGLAGGFQVLEPANANPTNIDMIRRFGGSTSPAMLWPEEEGAKDESDKFERLEKVILRATRKMGGGKKGSKAGGSSSMGQSSSPSGSGGSAGGSEDGSQ